MVERVEDKENEMLAAHGWPGYLIVEVEDRGNKRFITSAEDTTNALSQGYEKIEVWCGTLTDEETGKTLGEYPVAIGKHANSYCLLSPPCDENPYWKEEEVFYNEDDVWSGLEEGARQYVKETYGKKTTRVTRR